MNEKEDFNLLRYVISSDIRSSILVSLMEDSKSLFDLRSELDINFRNLYRATGQLIHQELITQSDGDYCLTNSGRLFILNLINFMDKSTEELFFQSPI